VPISHCFAVIMGRFAFRNRPMFSLCFVSEGHVTSAFHGPFWARAYARRLGVELNPPLELDILWKRYYLRKRD